MVIGVKYCGGCNPRYDRVQTAKKIMAMFPEFTFLINEKSCTDTAVILCGCSVACVAKDGKVSAKQAFAMKGPDDWESLCFFLEQLGEK